MSNNNELTCGSNEEDLMVVNKIVKGDKYKICFKCHDPTLKTIIFFRNESLCEACYLDLLRKKFKQQLSKCRSPTKPNRETEHIIVALSGGVSSSTMLELIYQNTVASKKSKLFFTPHCIYIDESSIHQNYQRDEIVEYLKQLTSKYGVNLDIIPLENIFETKDDNEENRKQLLNQSIQSLTSQTSREDIIYYYKEQLLRKLSEKYNAKRILYGNSSIQLSSRVFSSASKGRGFNIPHEISVTNDNPSDSVTLHNPLKDFLLKEIYIYHHYVLSPAPTQFSTFNRNIKASLNSLCEEFVHTLQDISNQSIYTLLRSVDKLVTPSSDKNFFCSLCHCSLTSNNIYKINNNNINNNNDKDDNCCSSNNNKDSCCSTNDKNSTTCCSNNNNNNNINLNLDTLCYSCKILCNEFKSSPVLPKYVYENSKTMVTSAQLKNEIKDFLLESDDEDN